MFDVDLAKARTKAGELSVEMKAAYKAAGDASGEGKAPLFATAKDMVLKLTEANAEVQRLEGEKRAYDEANALANDYLDVGTGRPALDKHPEPGSQASDVRSEQRQKMLRAAHTDAAVAFIRAGGDMGAAREVFTERGVEPTELATMIAGNARTGGMLVPPEWLAPRDDRELPPVMRGLCEVVTTGAETITVPLIDGVLETDNMTAEGYEHPLADRQDVTLGGVEIKLNDWHPKPIVVSQKLMRAPGTNIDQIVGTRIARRKNLDEDLQFITGTGAGEAYGLMRESGVAEINSQDATGLTWAGIINLVFDDVNGLGEEWSNGTRILMRRATFGEVLNTPDPAGNYVFRVAEAMAPRTILGEPTVFSPHMPTIALNAYPMIRGWFPAYTIADHTGGLMLKRLEEKYDPNVGFSVLNIFGGRTVQPAAFVKLKIAA